MNPFNVIENVEGVFRFFFKSVGVWYLGGALLAARGKRLPARNAIIQLMFS